MNTAEKTITYIIAYIIYKSLPRPVQLVIRTLFILVLIGILLGVGYLFIFDDSTERYQTWQQNNTECWREAHLYHDDDVPPNTNALNQYAAECMNARGYSF